MKYFNLVLLSVMLPAQLLQANVAHPATLRDLAAGKVSFRVFLTPRLAEVMRTNYQMIGKEIGLDPKITEVYTKYIDDVAEIAAQMNEASLVKVNIWNSMIRDDSSAITMHDIVQKLGIHFEDAERLQRITTFLREMNNISKSESQKEIKFESWSKQMSSLFSNYEDLNPATIGKINEHLLEMPKMAYAKMFGGDTPPEVNHLGEFKKEFAVFMDGLYQEVLEKLGVDTSHANLSVVAEQLRDQAVEEIISSLPEIKREVETEANLRLNTAIDLINERVPKGIEPNIREVARILAVKDDDTVKRFTHAIILYVSFTNLFKQKTDMTVTTEYNIIDGVRQLLHDYSSAIDPEELQELQEAVRIAMAQTDQ